jgi:hypothetical protein
MPTFAGTTPQAPLDGVVYASAAILTSSEASLGGGVVTPDPIPTEFGQAILAVVKLSANGIITANSTYVVMQMDLGDGTWVDLNWCFWAGTQGSATFMFSNGIAGANVVQQTRNSGSVPSPQANGSNQMTLAGRIRFVGQTVMTGGSSSNNVPTRVTATITYKLLGLK